MKNIIEYLNSLGNQYIKYIYNEPNNYLSLKKEASENAIQIVKYIKQNINRINNKNILYALREMDLKEARGMTHSKMRMRLKKLNRKTLRNTKQFEKIISDGVEKLENINKIRNIGEITNMLSIVVNFIKEKNLVCYGGQAINNILPKKKQFYKNTDIPDYDFFSDNAERDAIELANIFYKMGFKHIEVKEAVHEGTFKVFVDFNAVADVTFIPKSLFIKFQKDSIEKEGIKYASTKVLLMGLFIELSRPHGDVSRWEKLYKRLLLLIEHYPVDPEDMKDCYLNTIVHWDLPPCEITGEYPIQGAVYVNRYIEKYINEDSYHLLDKKDQTNYFKIISSDPKLNLPPKVALELENIQQKMEDNQISYNKAYQKYNSITKDFEKTLIFKFDKDKIVNQKIQKILYNILNKHNLAFGKDCFNLYKNVGNMNKKLPQKLCFKNTLYLLSENYQGDTNKLSDMFTKEKIKIVVKSHSSIFERVPKHNTITNKNNNQLIAIIFDIDGCYSYHTYKNVQIATIETMLRFYFSLFLFGSYRTYIDKAQINCWSYELLRILQYNTLISTRFFNKFTSNCIGKQIEMKDIMKKKWNKKKWKYRPEDKNKTYKKTHKKNTQTHKKHTKKINHNYLSKKIRH